MEKNQKKDLEQLLIKQTEKIFREVDPAITIFFSKHIKSHCKDLAKKFLKTQKKIQKQLKAIDMDNKISTPKAQANPVAKTLAPVAVTIKETSAIQAKKSSTTAEAAPKKTVVKKIRRGNNLMNSHSHQKKAKASLIKKIDNPSKK